MSRRGLNPPNATAASPSRTSTGPSTRHCMSPSVTVVPRNRPTCQPIARKSSGGSVTVRGPAGSYSVGQRGGTMPFVEIKVIDGVFGTEEKAEMVRAVTEAMLSVEGEAMRQVTWVTVNSVAGGEWGIGGQLLTTEAVQALRGQTATAGAR